MTRKWARMAALRGIPPQPGGTNDNDAHVCQPICINMYCIIIKKKLPIHWRKEWQKFQSCKFIHGQYFAIILFSLWCNSARHGHHCCSSPLGEVRILRRTATRTHFVVIKQRCWTVLFELWYEVASNLNTIFLSWKQRTAVKVAENAL